MNNITKNYMPGAPFTAAASLWIQYGVFVNNVKGICFCF